MKYKKKSINILSTIIILLTVPAIAYNIYYKTSRNNRLVNFTQINTLLFTDSADDKDLAAIQDVFEEVYEKVPEKVKTGIEKGNWKICVVKNVSDFYKIQTAYTPNTDTGSFTLKGITIPIYRLIVIENSDSETMKNVLMHEIGHVMNYVYGYICEGEEFEKAYIANKNSLDENTLNYVRENREEYFAECFKDYIYTPTEFKIICPETYNFFENITDKDNMYTSLKSRYTTSFVGGYRIITLRIVSVLENLRKNNFE